MNRFGAHHRRAPRRADDRDARRCSSGSASTPPRSAATTASCSSRTSGIVTMRPSDVPTYVEAGAADVGITGKDVLTGAARAPGRSSCSTSASGRCRMIVARRRRRARTRPPRRCAGSASCASRRSTRGSPRAYFEETGRQAEIVEVKGSVELAPLTGLVEAIVDLTATGHDAARERPRHPRGDRDVDRAADRRPGRPQAQGGRRSTSVRAERAAWPA